MLSFLGAREAGVDSPRAIRKAECTRRVFSLELSKYFDVQRIHDGAINALHIDAIEERYLLSGATNGTVVIHDLHDTAGIPQFSHPDVGHVGRGNRHRHKFSIETVQWYPLDTGMFVTSGMDKLLKVWDTNTMTAADEFEFSGGVYCHDMSPIAVQHSLIVVATNSAKVRLLDLKSGSATHVLRGHRQSVLSAQWSPREEFLLATGGQDSKVMLWDIRSAKGALMVLDQHNGDTSSDPNSVNCAHNGLVNSVQFTPDGLHLLTFGLDDQLRLWLTATGKNTMVNFGKIHNECRKGIKLAVCSLSQPEVVFLPDASDIAMMDIFSGSRLAVLQGHYSQVNSVTFHNANTDLYSCGNDRNILIWKPYLETMRAYEGQLQGLEGTAVEGADSRPRVPSGPTTVGPGASSLGASAGFVRRTEAADEWSDED